MHAVSRLAAAVGLAALAAFALALPWAGGPPLARELYDLLVGEPGRGAEIASRSREVARCRAGKREAAHELLAGRITLAEAAERFERLDAEAGGSPLGAGRPPTVESVLLWAESELRGRADGTEVLERLRQGPSPPDERGEALAE